MSCHPFVPRRRRSLVRLASIAASLAVAAAAQTAPAPTPAPAPATAGADLQELARRVEAAHWPKGPVPSVTSLRAALELDLRDKDAENRGQVDLKLQYLEWERAAGKPPIPLLRYEVLDAGKPVVRGRDRKGPWQIASGQPRDLTGADDTQDLRAFQQHTNLVRQMVRFLSPGDTLRRLQAPSDLADEELRIGRLPAVACTTVSGRLDAFPLLQQGGEDAAVQLKVWVEKATGRLVALDATPVRGDSLDEARSERVLLGEFVEDQGMLVPRLVQHYFRGADGQLQLKTRTRLHDLSLRAELRAEDFDR